MKPTVKKNLSPVNTVRNFDLSYVTSRMTNRWPDSTYMTNKDLKVAFDHLLEQAKKTELRMQDILGDNQRDIIPLDDSTDENCIRSATPTDGPIGNNPHYL